MPENPSLPRAILTLISRLDAHHRLIVSIVAALVFYLSFLGHLQWGKHFLLSWDVFTLCLLALAWTRILTAQPKVVLRTARLQHSARKGIFLFVLAAACASLAAVFFLLRPAKALSGTKAGEHIAMALGTVLLSWALIHTIFALQYAYLFYCRHPAGEGTALIFPEGKGEPDYCDFAYFSFIIGMTSQVSDVQVGSKEVRCWVLLHGLISFAFNTAVLALGINAVSGLL
ncbi:MAG: DUF1345 domain-containing protein [Verrucomicrobiae bacterium]